MALGHCPACSFHCPSHFTAPPSLCPFPLSSRLPNSKYQSDLSLPHASLTTLCRWFILSSLMASVLTLPLYLQPGCSPSNSRLTWHGSFDVFKATQIQHVPKQTPHHPLSNYLSNHLLQIGLKLCFSCYLQPITKLPWLCVTCPSVLPRACWLAPLPKPLSPPTWTSPINSCHIVFIIVI